MSSLFKYTCTIPLALALASPPAFAQDTRAEMIAQEQAERAQRLEPNLPTTVEKALEWVEGYFTDPNTAYLTFGGVYPSAGFAPGIGVRRAFGRARFNAGAAYSVRAYKSAYASLGFPGLANDHVDIDTHVKWTDATQVPFYGVGNDSFEDDRVNYGLRMLDAGGGISLKPVRWFRIGGAVALQQIEDRGGAGSDPSIETFPGVVPGISTDTSYRQTSVFTAIDWRESSGYTRRGGLYSIALHDFNESDNPLSFRRVDAEVQQMIPVLKEHWVLAFRGLVQTTDADDGQVVPYYLLPRLGGANRHRGYSDFRFQDRHMLLLSGEYRWTPSRVLDMAIFVDAGKVTSDRSDLDFDGLKTAYGVGARIHGPNFTPVRLDVAHGKEGFRFHITGGVGF